MQIQVKPDLKVSINNNQYDLRKRKGTIIQQLDDGWCLIEFDIQIQDQYRNVRKLEWYIHETDFNLYF